MVNGNLIQKLHRQAAGYVSRLLQGEGVGDLPVHAPTKFELVINLKTPEMLGLDQPRRQLQMKTVRPSIANLRRQPLCGLTAWHASMQSALR
jgi:hypothetical protein